jgi:hypothetical protein
MLTAEKLMLIGGVAVFVLTLYWVRSRELSEKFAVVWTFLAFVLLICGLFPNLIMSFASKAHLSYSSAVLFIALAAIYVFSFSVSVALTQHHRRNVRISQELAILENRIKSLECTLRESNSSRHRDTHQATQTTPSSRASSSSSLGA